jgi:hypothetical protein
MPRYHNINGNRVQFTAEEETARDAEEQAWRDGAFDRKIADLRQRRNSLLSATDFYGLQDVSMTQDMTNYRQALRDLPDGLTTVEDVEAVTWPTKP